MTAHQPYPRNQVPAAAVHICVWSPVLFTPYFWYYEPEHVRNCHRQEQVHVHGTNYCWHVRVVVHVHKFECFVLGYISDLLPMIPHVQEAIFKGFPNILNMSHSIFHPEFWLKTENVYLEWRFEHPFPTPRTHIFVSAFTFFYQIMQE